MDNYESPSSEIGGMNLSDKPIRAVLYGFLIAVVGVFIFSAVGTVGFSIMNKVDMTSQEAIRNAVTSSPGFMVFDLVGSLLILVLAGRVVAICAPSKALLLSVIVTIPVILLFGSPMLMDAASSYPLWYSLVIGFSLIFGVPLGVKTARSAA